MTVQAFLCQHISSATGYTVSSVSFTASNILSVILNTALPVGGSTTFNFTQGATKLKDLAGNEAGPITNLVLSRATTSVIKVFASSATTSSYTIPNGNTYPTKIGSITYYGTKDITPVTGGAWNTTNNTSSSSFTTSDFGINKTISQLRVTALSGTGFLQANCPLSFNIEYSSDNSAWSIASSVTNQTTWTNGEVKSFLFTSQTARYWRVSILSNNAGTQTDVAELGYFT